MRDPKRMNKLLDVLKKCWEKEPDWRFGQLMVNFLNQLPRDPFFYEEDEMIEEMKKYFEIEVE